MTDFDYTAPAELFIGKGRGSAGGGSMTYRRFPTSAEAIKYAVETLKPVSLVSAALSDHGPYSREPRRALIVDFTFAPTKPVTGLRKARTKVINAPALLISL